MAAPVIQFSPAQHRKVKAKVALSGPAGSGKSAGGLHLARGLAKGGQIVAIETATENERLPGYVSITPFLHGLLQPPYTPERYLEACHIAINAGAEVLLIDSLTPEWNGKGGILAIVDATPMKNGKKDTYGDGWRKASPMHTDFIADLIALPVHVIATMRTKMAYERTGSSITKVGLEPIQRDETPYEFDFYLMQDMDHQVRVDKHRTLGLLSTGQVFKPHEIETLGGVIRDWAEAGEVAPKTPAVKVAPAAAPAPAAAKAASAPATAPEKPQEPAVRANSHKSHWQQRGQATGHTLGLMLRLVRGTPEGKDVPTIDDLNPNSPAGQKLEELLTAVAQ